MRKLIGISLLLLFTTGQLGYYFVYSYQQYRIKETAKKQLLANIPESAFMIVLQDDQAIRWEEEGSEFYLHGEMYDVVKVKTNFGRTYLYCINDKKEEKLLSDFANAINSNSDNNDNGKQGKSVAKFEISDLVIPQREKLICVYPATRQYNRDLHTGLLTFFSKVTAPPPKV